MNSRRSHTYYNTDVTGNTPTLVNCILTSIIFKFNNTKLLLLRDENVNKYD